MILRTKCLLLFIAAFSIFCYPIINSGYYGDDSLHSFIGSVMAERNISLSEQYIINLKAFLPTRLSILHFYHWMFLIFTDLITYKLYSSAMVAAALTSTYFVTKAFVKNSPLPFLIVVFTMLIGIQFREYGDSVLLFHGATSLALILLNLSILTFVRFLKSTKKIFLACSLIFFTLSCLSYELIYPFCFIYFGISIILGHRSLKQAAKYLSLFVTPVALLTIPNIISRLLIKVPKDVSDPIFHKAYEFSLNLGAIFLVFAKELVASLPLSNLIINPFGSLTINNLLPSSGSVLLLVLLTLAFSTIFYYALKDIKKPSREDKVTGLQQNYFLLFIYAIMLVVVPNGIIALSPKYQTEIIWGSGYVSLYFGYVGASILACLAIYPLLTKFKTPWIVLGLSLFLGITAGANFSANSKTVEVLNTFWKYPRTVAEESLRRGILSELETGAAYMFTNNNYPWDVTSFIHKYSGKFLNQEQYTGGEGRFFGGKTNENFLISGRKSRSHETFSPKADRSLTKHLKLEIQNNYYFDIDGDKNVYYFDYYADSNDSGYALLANVKKAFISQAHINGVASNRVKIYLRMPHQRGVYSTMNATFLALDPTTLRPVSTVRIQENQFKVISQGIGWKMIELNSDINKFLIDVKSIRLNTSQKSYETSLFPGSLSDKKNFKFNVESNAELFHISLTSPFDNSHIAFDPVKLGKEFSIALSVRLTENAVLAPYAHIAGNHPGKNNFEGFVIQKKPIGENVFDLYVGDGTAWRHVVDFTLRSDSDTFVGVSVKDKKILGLINDTVFHINLGFDIQDSDMPVYVGNYVGGDRPFSGQVNELLITNTALPKDLLVKFRKSIFVK